MSNYWARNK